MTIFTMSPLKQIVVDAIQLYLVDKLEAYGVKFSESQLKFTRHLDEFRNELVFIGNLKNCPLSIQYTAQVRIWKSAYVKWLKNGLGIADPRQNGLVIGNRDRLHLYNSNNAYRLSYDFSNQSHEDIMSDIHNFIIKSGLHYFEDNDSDYKIAQGNNGLESLDFAIMAKEIDAAKERVQSFLSSITDDKLAQHHQLHYYKEQYEIRDQYLKQFP